MGATGSGAAVGTSTSIGVSESVVASPDGSAAGKTAAVVGVGVWSATGAST
ncbi:hypothetical protein [Cryptosporangium aurantiacum]|uniref:hypothetical protein n=1 Tax=Cryptosporangium aurantiacum TaxID=134849 RepID=UPI0015BAEC77|nr:hypothetical protein [Cryptosporangium aurantiacum]